MSHRPLFLYQIPKVQIKLSKKTFNMKTPKSQTNLIAFSSFLVYGAFDEKTLFNKNKLSSSEIHHRYSSVTPNNPSEWLKRFARELRSLHNRTVTEENSKIYGTTSQTERYRIKRQSPGKLSLCDTTSQYVTPQAALNSKGLKLLLFLFNFTNFFKYRQLDVCGQRW